MEILAQKVIGEYVDKTMGMNRDELLFALCMILHGCDPDYAIDKAIEIYTKLFRS